MRIELRSILGLTGTLLLVGFASAVAADEGTGHAAASSFLAAPLTNMAIAPATPVSSGPPAPSAAGAEDWSSNPVQPDFTVINLPAPLRMPVHKVAFRVTHRFTRSLNQGSFSESLQDAFGLDSGAQVGLELRVAPFRRAQLTVYRTNDKSVDFGASYNVLEQDDRTPIALSVVATLEGTNNFKDEYSPSIAVTLSRGLGRRAAIYLVPTWVGNSNIVQNATGIDDQTFYLGLGARVQVSKGLYLTGEASPRLSGFKGGINVGRATYEEGRTAAAFALEKQVGGHVFQINFSNSFSTTPATLARGAAPGKTNWYLGFNISRKF